MGTFQEFILDSFFRFAALRMYIQKKKFQLQLYYSTSLYPTLDKY